MASRRNISFRRALLEDRDRVLDIHKNVFDGRDYLPPFYNKYLKDPCRRSFLAETDDEVVSFMTLYVVDGGKTIIAEAGRTNEIYQKSGISVQMGMYGTNAIMSEFPNVVKLRRTVYYEEEKDLYNGKRFYDVGYIWNCLVWKIQPEVIQNLLGNINLKQKIDAKVKDVPSTSIIQTLTEVKEGGLVFPSSAAPIKWLPLEMKHPNFELIKNDLKAVVFTSRSESNQHTSVSFGTDVHIPVKLGLRHAFDYYGTSVNDLLDHILKQLFHFYSQDISKTVYMMVGFPFELDRVAVVKYLKEEIGGETIDLGYGVVEEQDLDKMDLGGSGPKHVSSKI